MASVLGFVDHPAQAGSVLQRLRDGGFRPDEVSILYASGADDALLAGGVPELGWLGGIGPLQVSGLGTAVAAGPLMANLGGVAVGSVAEGVADALIDLGMDAPEARSCEERVRGGEVLIAVLARDGARIAQAKGIFQDSAVHGIASSIGGEQCDEGPAG